MDNEQGQEAAPQEEPEELRGGWFDFDRLPVAVQLREPWLAVGAGYRPMRPRDADGTEQDASLAAPMLTGVLRVHPYGQGEVMFVLQTASPDGNGVTYVAFKASEVLYCTHRVEAQPSRIVTP